MNLSAVNRWSKRFLSVFLAVCFGLFFSTAFGMAPAMLKQKRQGARPHAPQRVASDNSEEDSADSEEESPGFEDSAPTEEEQEIGFLTKLGENIKNPEVSERIHSIVETLENSGELGQEDHDFLIRLAQKISNKKIAEVLEKIAESYQE